MASQALRPPTNVNPDDLLAFCKATADSLRIDILRVLREESFGVLELCRIFEMPQPGMSHHLKILSGAGLAESRREGNSIFYRRSMITFERPIGELIHSFYAAIDRIPVSADVAGRTETVHLDRARNSRQFFEKNANRLKENQGLIAELDQYVGCVKDLLRNEQIKTDAKVLEVGPGESNLLNLLAKNCHRLVALDNSKEMLGKAAANLAPEYAAKVQFIQGEPETLTTSSADFDLMVLNMVLHHLPSPARLFRTAGQLLLPEGRLLIIDLRPHNQDWAREICGDLWLGFDPADLDQWALEAGLVPGQSVYLGLKNGFQVQVRLFQQPMSID